MSAWRAIGLFLLLTACLSGVFWTLINVTQTPNPYYVWLLMWMPGVSALLTCRILRRPLRTLGRTWNWRYVLIGYLIPIGYCLVASLAIWIFGAGGFPNADTVHQAATSLGLPGAPDWVVIAMFAAVTGTAAMIAGVGAALGEEIGWRGFLVPELAKVLPFTGVALASGMIWASWHYRYCWSWPSLAGAGVTVARPSSRVLARPGGRDLVPRVPGRWRLPVFACRSSSAAWSVALTTRSSGRVRVTPFRRRALRPWGTSADHGGGCPVPGDVLNGSSPPRLHFGSELVSPDHPGQVRQFRLRPYRSTKPIAVRYPITAVVYRDADVPAWFWLPTFTVSAIAVSFVLAWLRLKTDSLWPGVFLHASHNLWMQSIFTPLTSEKEYTKWVAGDLGLGLVVVATVVAVVFWAKRGDLKPRASQPV